MSKKIKIEYFAKLREEVKSSGENFETDSRTALELFEELKKKYDFSFSQNNLKVAINEEFSDWDSEIKDNDTVVFIPPVAGG